MNQTHEQEMIPNLRVFTPEEKEALFEKLTDLLLAGNEEEYNKLLKKYPLTPKAAKILEQDFGIEVLKASGWNLSEAVQEFGPEWLES